MKNIRAEVYIEDFSLTRVQIDIFSHVKNAWVFHSVGDCSDILNLFADLMIRPESSIIHLSSKSPVFRAIRGKGYETKLFVGMSGTYQTSSGAVYKLEYQPSPKPPRRDRHLYAEVSNPTEYKQKNRFVVDPDHIQRNVRFGSWKKIEA